MLARFATGASFSTDSRGGGKESNSKFLPFMIQMARHLLDHDSSQCRILAKSIATYLASSTLESRSPTGSGTQTSGGTEETVQFMMVSSLLSESYESWVQHRRGFLQRIIYHAYMKRTHGRSMQQRSSSSLPTSIIRSESGSSSSGTLTAETGNPDELLSIVQQMLVYTGLIEQLQRFFKVKKSANSNAAVVQSKEKAEGEEESLEDWEVVMKERLVNVKEMVAFSSELLSWLDDMMSSTDLQEAFDVIGVLGDVLSGGVSKCEEETLNSFWSVLENFLWY